MTLLTVTLNTALDVTYPVDLLTPGATNRTETPSARAGGKGVNVARILHALGLGSETVVLGFAGGPTGTAFRADLDAAGIHAELVPTDGETRRTVAVTETTTGDATLFNEPGPRITTAEWRSLLDRFRVLASAARVVVLSGSLPPGAPPDAYGQLTAASTGPVILDAGGPALAAGLAARPAVVKPNVTELAAATGLQGVREGAGALRARGAETVVVSDGPAGMTLFTGPVGRSDPESWHAAPPEAVHGNPTGAGDAAAAALARGLASHTPWPEVLADAVALSAAAVAAPVAGSFDPVQYARFRPLIRATPAAPKESHAARTHR